MLTAFEQMPEDRRRRAIADSIRRLRDTRERLEHEESAADSGDTNRPPKLSPKLQEKMVTLGRYTAAHGLMAVKAVTVMGLALSFGCLPVKPAAAPIHPVSFIFLNFILMNIPWFADLKPWFLTYHLNLWQHLYGQGNQCLSCNDRDVLRHPPSRPGTAPRPQ